MRNSDVKNSRFLSYVLRHRPDTIDLQLDENGWADVDELLDKAQRNGKTMSRHDLERIVAENDKKRFAFSDDGSRIRASQGHSVDVKLELEPIEPPMFLYHGTVARFLDSIMTDGLKKGNRHHVHLSADKETATKVGERRGKPVILRIDAEKMHETGTTFFRSDNGVWLVDHVPPEYLTING